MPRQYGLLEFACHFSPRCEWTIGTSYRHSGVTQQICSHEQLESFLSDIRTLKGLSKQRCTKSKYVGLKRLACSLTSAELAFYPFSRYLRMRFGNGFDYSSFLWRLMQCSITYTLEATRVRNLSYSNQRHPSYLWTVGKAKECRGSQRPHIFQLH
jgi:hypothetical protein